MNIPEDILQLDWAAHDLLLQELSHRVKTISSADRDFLPTLVVFERESMQYIARIDFYKEFSKILAHNGGREHEQRLVYATPHYLDNVINSLDKLEDALDTQKKSRYRLVLQWP